MKISVTESGSRNIQLRLPTGLVFNGFTARFLSGSAQKHGAHITPKQAAALVKAMNSFRRSHPSWVLVEVDSADGSRVEITL